MAIINQLDAMLIARLSMGVRRFDIHEMSGETGDSADRLLGAPRWLLSIQSPEAVDAAAMDLWRQLIVKLRGRVNFLAAWDKGRPAPRGTMRGTMLLSGAIVKGATTLTIDAGAGQAGTTLLAGDWLQIGSALTGQLVMVVDDATANGAGVIVVNFEHPIRLQAGYAGSTAITWDKALGHYKLTSESAMWVMDGGLKQGGAAADFMEQW